MNPGSVTPFRSATGAPGYVVRTSASSDVSADPSITSGSGAPSAAEPNGSIYLRTDGTAGTLLYRRISGAWRPTGPTTGTATGTGSAQNVAHGLGVIPTAVAILPLTATASPLPIVEGTHTTTNIVITLPADATFRWIAWA